MVDEIRLLPLGSIDEFTGDRRNIGAAESCLRRALEALLDLGRHLLAKIFGEAVTEYKKIAEKLERKEMLAADAAHQLRVQAGYRNRMVHFDHDATEAELYAICTRELQDLLAVRDAYVTWLKKQPECVDTTL
jgi:uncharacterized protein YutE (UPF0331/DUF86 family)